MGRVVGNYGKKLENNENAPKGNVGIMTARWGHPGKRNGISERYISLVWCPLSQTLSCPQSRALSYHSLLLVVSLSRGQGSSARQLRFRRWVFNLPSGLVLDWRCGFIISVRACLFDWLFVCLFVWAWDCWNSAVLIWSSASFVIGICRACGCRKFQPSMGEVWAFDDWNGAIQSFPFECVRENGRRFAVMDDFSFAFSVATVQSLISK